MSMCGICTNYGINVMEYIFFNDVIICATYYPRKLVKGLQKKKTRV